MPRHHGRMLYPSTLAERRLMLQLGGKPALRVRRGVNPFLLGRRLARAARTENPDLLFVRDVLAQRKPSPNPRPSPDGDSPEPLRPAPVEAQQTAPSDDEPRAA